MQHHNPHVQGVHVSYDLFHPVLGGSFVRLCKRKITKNRLCQKFQTIFPTCPGTSLTVYSDRSRVSILCSYSVCCTLYFTRRTMSMIPSPASPLVLCVFQDLEREKQPPWSQSLGSLKASLECHMLESHSDPDWASVVKPTSSRLRVLRSWGLYVPLCTAAGGGR